MRDKLLCIILFNMTLLSDKEMTEVFSRWQAENPEPASELEYVNPFTLLVAVVLSAQTTDKGVNSIAIVRQALLYALSDARSALGIENQDPLVKAA